MALKSWNFLITDVIDVTYYVSEVVFLGFDRLSGYRLDFLEITSAAVCFRSLDWSRLFDPGSR